MEEAHVGITRVGQGGGTVGVFDRDHAAERRRRVHTIDGVASQGKLPVVSRGYDAEERRIPGPLVQSEGREGGGGVDEVGEEKKRQYPMPGQIIVYCDMVEKAVQYARLLQCVCYHRQVGSRGEKAELVRQLTEGRQQVFTATNALGLGVDAPTIRVVIHVGVVRKLRDYAQESGRAGRDGEKSEAIIIRGVTYDRAGRVREEGWGNVEEEMRAFVTSEGCMRVILDSVMDGRVDRAGCEDGEEKCCRCSAGWLGAEADDTGEDGEEEVGNNERVAFEQAVEARRVAAYQEMASQSEEMMEVQGLEEILDEWKEGCPWCRACGEACEGHDIAGCTRTGAEDVQKGIDMMADLIQWERFSGCFQCGVPQAICEGFENAVDGGWKKRYGGVCQYQGVLFASMASIWTISPWANQLGPY